MTNIARGLSAVLLAASLGGCSTVGSMWSSLIGGRDKPVDSAATLAPPAEAAAAPAPQSGVCDTLRANATPATTPDAASRQMAIAEMKRIGCADVPAS